MGLLNFFRRFFEKSPPLKAKPADLDEEPDQALPDYIEITDELDLHGCFPEQAGRMVPDFLQNAVQLGLEEVKIIHGKGSGNMKAAVLRVLSNHPLVASFRDAPPYSSGWGATLVRLRDFRNPP